MSGPREADLSSDSESNAQQNGAGTHRKPLETDTCCLPPNTNSNNHNVPLNDESSYSSSYNEEGFFHDDGDFYHRASGSGVDSTTADNNDNYRPSNERLLGTAFCSFMSFALVQLFFAFIAGSQAMKGDSAAMIVDALTYLFNLIAEHKKNHFDWNDHHHHHHNHQSTIQNGGSMDPTRLQRLRKRAYRKMVLEMEILPPLLSVATLLIVTVVVIYQALLVLMGIKATTANSKHPDLYLMMGFSIFNLGLDLLNVFCFARANHLMGYETTAKGHQQHHHGVTGSSSSTATTIGGGGGQAIPSSTPAALASSGYALASGEGSLSSSPSSERTSSDEELGGSGATRATITNGRTAAAPPTVVSADDSEHSEDDDEDDDDEHRPNLNMCSAYTHVFADTLRSLAVILAASIAVLVPSVATPEQADATAAIAVSILIALSLIPLFHGLRQSISELRGIYGEEKSEILLQQTTTTTTNTTGIMS